MTAPCCRRSFIILCHFRVKGQAGIAVEVYNQPHTVYVLVAIADIATGVFVLLMEDRLGRCQLDRQRAHPSYGVVFAA